MTLEVDSWSTSAALNTSVAGIDIGEGCARENVNDGLRATMAAVKAKFDALPVIQLESYGAVGDCDPTAGTGTDDSAALTAALAHLYSVGGGTIQLSTSWYRVTGNFAFANDASSASDFGTQPSVRIVGAGSGNNGQGNAYLAASGLYWTADSGTGDAKIVTTGLGTLVLEDFQLASNASCTKPFIKTTFTTLHISRMGFCTGRTGRACVEDGVIFGGTVDHETDTTYDRRLSNAGFQGYGSTLTDSFFSGIRTCAILQRFANSIRIRDNNIWSTCGCATGTTSAAFYVNGQSSSNAATGWNIDDNLIEVTNYDYGIIAENCANGKMRGNDMWDATAGCLGGVWLKSTASGCFVMEGATGGLYAISGVYTLDEGAGAPNSFIRTENEEYSKLVAIQTASSTSNPNVFGATTFSDGTHTLFKPGSSGIAYSINALCDDGTTPAFRVETNGADATATATARFYSANAQFAMLTQGGLYLASGNVLYINNQQVVGARVTGLPAAATDAATTQTLVNEIRAALITHGLIS
jgi:hypothetical protein